MLSAVDQLLIDTAMALIASLPADENHTVAAVARDAEGRLFEGVNLYHFTGGPCAEPVALAGAAAGRAAPLEVIVAVGNRARGVLAPCGRCRQILFDYHPKIDVLVPDGPQVRRVGIRDLLPYTYDWHAEQEGERVTAWTPFQGLNDVLQQLSLELQRVLGPEVLALYLTGSFALGDADEGSDVDFLAVTRGPLTGARREAVQTLHQTLFGLPTPWARHLEGSYFPADLLRHPDPQGTPLPYLDNGSRILEDSAHDNTLVVRRVTREHGTPLFGPPARELIKPVQPEALRTEVEATLHRWGAALLADTEGLNDGWRQPYVALSMARMLQTIQTGEVHSKRAAVDWSREHLDPKWTPMLERAWASHPRQFLNVSRPADPADLAMTRDFIRYALAFSPVTDGPL